MRCTYGYLIFVLKPLLIIYLDDIGKHLFRLLWRCVYIFEVDDSRFFVIYLCLQSSSYSFGPSKYLCVVGIRKFHFRHFGEHPERGQFALHVGHVHALSYEAHLVKVLSRGVFRYSLSLCVLSHEYGCFTGVHLLCGGQIVEGVSDAY